MLHKISASAGSGKTYTLTRKFLELLEGASLTPQGQGCLVTCPEAPCNLDSILAATFTNKAAAEMKSRILNALKEQALEELKTHRRPGRAGGWVRTILQRYSSLNIRTIDSLLTTLVRLSVLELNVSPNFQPSFTLDEYFQPVYDRLMEDLHPDSLRSNDAFLTASVAALREALEQSATVLVLLNPSGGFMAKGSLRDALSILVNRLLTRQPMPAMQQEQVFDCINVLQSRLRQQAKCLTMSIEAEKLQAQQHLLNFLEKLLNWQGLIPLPESKLILREGLEDCLKKASENAAPGAAHAAYLTLQDIYFLSANAYTLLRSALRYAPLTLLATEIWARVLQEQEHGSLLPALTIPFMAQDVLSGQYGVSDAMCRLGTRLTHLLLDEFQDTDQQQWGSLLPLVCECLAHGGSLTYVGDVKQAIYSWRGGDTSLFNAAAQEPTLTAIAGQAKEHILPHNWRSAPAIVRHNNLFFSLLADKAIAEEVAREALPPGTPAQYINNAASLIAKSYSHSEQALPPHKQKQEEGTVRIYEVEGPTVSSVQHAVSERLASLFLDELPAKWAYRDIAVLVRSNEESTYIASQLSSLGIPVMTERSFLLAEHPLIARLIAFLRFLNHPFDDLAFWEFISGPECFGMVAYSQTCNQALLRDWLARESLSPKRLSLSLLFRSAYPDEWQRWIAPFYNQGGLMSAYDTLYEVLAHYNLADLCPDATPFLRRLLEITYQAEEQGASSLAAFLHLWDSSGKEERLPVPNSINAVQVMTIHKAKGLEFPVVILPQHHYRTVFDKKLQVFSYQDQEFLAMAGKELPATYYPTCITSILESLNLLYVAWTRPVAELHAFVTCPATAFPDSVTAKSVRLLLDRYKSHPLAPHVFFETITVDGEEEETSQESALHASLEASLMVPKQEQEPVPLAATEGVTAPALKALHTDASSWHPMQWLPDLKIFRSVLAPPTLTAERRGTLVHLSLEHLRLSPLLKSGDAVQIEQQLRADIAIAVQLALQQQPFVLSDLETIRRDLESSLLWFAGLPEARRWLATGRREQGLMNAEGEVFRVDLVVPEGSHNWSVIDYKTGAAQPSYQAQVRNYMHLLQKASGYNVQGVLVYLDEQRMEPVEL